MKKRKYIYTKVLLIIILLIAYSLHLNATKRYVSKTGLSIPPYISWENAADSIQKCINISVFGDTIYVANGIYEEQVVMIPGLSLIGAGIDSCLIDTRNIVTASFHAVEVVDSCLFKGFYVIVSYNTDLGDGIVGQGNSVITLNKTSNATDGIIVVSSPTVYNNICINNRKGISVLSSSSLIRKNTVFMNYPNGYGIQIQASSSNYKPIVDSNYIETNYYGIYKNPGTRSTITNNIIKLINGSEGIFLHSYYSDSNWVNNNLIFTDLAGYALYTNGSNYLKIENNYAKGNFINYALSIGPNHKLKNNVVTNSEGGIEAWGTQNMVYQYNNAWENDVNYSGFTPDSTNLSVDPMIVNDDSTKGDLDFYLQMFSPLIDAGDPDILDKDSTRSDIGLYGGPYGESYIYVDLPPRSPVNLNANVADSTITLTWNKNTEADFSYYNLYCDTVMNFQIDSTKLVASITDTFYYYIIPIGAESLYFKLTGGDNQGNESNPSEEVAVILVSVMNEWVLVNNYILYQNYPNPFNPSTTIGYKLKERGYVKLYVYDIKGELVNVLVNQVQETGYYEAEFSASSNQHPESRIQNLASGVYIYQIIITGENNIPVFSDIKKMIYIK